MSLSNKYKIKENITSTNNIEKLIKAIDPKYVNCNKCKQHFIKTNNNAFYFTNHTIYICNNCISINDINNSLDQKIK